jgi:hypothetical protein
MQTLLMNIVFLSVLSLAVGSGPNIIDGSGMLSQYSQADKVGGGNLIMINVS